MQDQSAGAKRNDQSRDLLSAAEFFDVLRHVVGFREQPAIIDPLQQAVDQIGSNPAFAQSRLLQRILIALTTGQEEFRRAEAAVLDAATHALIIALLDLHRAGTRPQQDWSKAVEAAAAASA